MHTTKNLVESAELPDFSVVSTKVVYDLDSLIEDLDDLLPAPTTLREKIYLIEAELAKMPQTKFETKHHFASGLYAREIFIPKGGMLTGALHKTEHLNIVTKGRITVLTEDGIKKNIKAPFTIVSRPGTKKVGYAHEDTIWTTIHATAETELSKIEADLIAEDFSDPDLIRNMKIKIVRDSKCLLP